MIRYRLEVRRYERGYIASPGHQRARTRPIDSRLFTLFLFGVMLVLIMTAGCEQKSGASQTVAAEAEFLFIEKGCVSCHQYRAINQAQGLVGPPLDHFSERAYIAGLIPNTVENLTQWLLDPSQFHVNSAMPNIGLSELEAEIISLYLLREHNSIKTP